jgi:hypothetical protein
MRTFATFLIAGWAGFVVMALELLAGRYLNPYFGGSVMVWGGIICLFLVTLALGYITGGSLSKMAPTVRMLAVFLFAAAALIMPAYAQAQAILVWVFTQVQHPGWGALVAALGLFGGASYVLGMVPPYALRLLVSQTQTSGSTAGWLYFAGTLGSAGGTILTAFYLVLWFTLPQILLGLIGVSVLIGLFGFFVASGDDGY